MDSMRGSEAKAAVAGGADPDSAYAGDKLKANTRRVKSPYMAGTVYPYSYQDMPIRDIRRLYLSHDRTTAVHPIFHAGVSAKPYR